MDRPVDDASDHFYLFGDVYEALDACGELENLLGRLKRQHLLDEDDWKRSKDDVLLIRDRIEAPIRASSLRPRGPSF